MPDALLDLRKFRPDRGRRFAFTQVPVGGDAPPDSQHEPVTMTIWYGPDQTELFTVLSVNRVMHSPPAY